MAAGGIPNLPSVPPPAQISLRFPELSPTRHASDLSHWPNFSILDSELLKTVKKICVFGSSGNEAIFITDNDDVYAFGSNCNGCLGLGQEDSPSSLEPRKVDILCQKRLINIACGSGPHVVAVTQAGEVYSWGHNEHCQHGNGSTHIWFRPGLVTTNLGRNVVKVACGSYHTMALTSGGEIYAWGLNSCGQVGTGSTANVPSPRKITVGIECRPALAIACGQSSSVALMDNGEVYGWGCNGKGQLGVGNNANQPNPCRVLLPQGVVVKQVVCGMGHILALSNEGVTYSWGANAYGQLGTGYKFSTDRPVKVICQCEKYVEIAANHYRNISVAMSQTGKVYIWGECREQSLTQPRSTTFASTDDAFAAFSAPPISWRMYCLDYIKGSRIADAVANAFDNQETSDVRFVVERKDIHVHKTILKMRCEHFRTMFKSCWDEGSRKSIVIADYTYTVYRAFLRYLYTDDVDLQPDEAIGLLDLSNCYREELLKMKCEGIICQGISVENVAMFYAAAIILRAQQLEEFCFRFALNHMTEVTQSEAFAKLDESVAKAFIVRASKAGVFSSRLGLVGGGQ